MKGTARAFLALLILALPGTAAAAYNCNVTSSGFSAVYSPTVPGANVTQATATITCTRAASDANSMNFLVLANNGSHATGNQNRAAFGASLINYDLYRDGACGSQWSGFANIGGTVSFGGSLSASETIDYWACIPPGQTGKAAGTYTDTVTLTLVYSFLRTDTGLAPVTIVTPPSCNLTTAPSNLVFDYTAFGPAANASTNFGVTCTSTVPYTMALDATSGTLLGLNYALSLSANSATGSGVQQMYSINGTMAAGQAGTCASGSCTASQGRTLTITY
jgi:spore coat protein U-like protein